MRPRAQLKKDLLLKSHIPKDSDGPRGRRWRRRNRRYHRYHSYRPASATSATTSISTSASTTTTTSSTTTSTASCTSTRDPTIPVCGETGTLYIRDTSTYNRNTELLLGDVDDEDASEGCCVDTRPLVTELSFSSAVPLTGNLTISLETPDNQSQQLGVADTPVVFEFEGNSLQGAVAFGVWKFTLPRS